MLYFVRCVNQTADIITVGKKIWNNKTLCLIWTKPAELDDEHIRLILRQLGKYFGAQPCVERLLSAISLKEMHEEMSGIDLSAKQILTRVLERFYRIHVRNDDEDKC